VALLSVIPAHFYVQATVIAPPQVKGKVKGAQMPHAGSAIAACDMHFDHFIGM